MSTSNGNTSNPSLDTGRSETSGSANQKALYNAAEDELLALRSILAIAYVAVIDTPDMGHGASGDARAYFYGDARSLIPERLDWLDVECSVRHALRRACRATEQVVDQLGDEFVEFQRELLMVLEAFQVWALHIEFNEVRIPRVQQAGLGQMLRVLLRTVDRLSCAYPPFPNAKPAAALEVVA